MFVCDTLKDARLRRKILGHEAKGHSAILPNYTKVSVQVHGPYPTILPVPQAEVKGIVFSVSEQDLKKLDDWERLYSRQQVRLADGSYAWAYRIKLHRHRIKSLNS